MPNSCFWRKKNFLLTHQQKSQKKTGNEIFWVRLACFTVYRQFLALFFFNFMLTSFPFYRLTHFPFYSQNFCFFPFYNEKNACFHFTLYILPPPQGRVFFHKLYIGGTATRPRKCFLGRIFILVPV